MIRSIGMGLLMAPITTAFMNSVPQNKIGVASSMNNIIMQVGASLGIAFFTTVLSTRSVFHIAMVGQAVKSGNPVFRQSVGNIMQHVHSLGYGLVTANAAGRGLLMSSLIKSGVIRAFQDTFLIASIIVILAVP